MAVAYWNVVWQPCSDSHRVMVPYILLIYYKFF